MVYMILNLVGEVGLEPTTYRSELTLSPTALPPELLPQIAVYKFLIGKLHRLYQTNLALLSTFRGQASPTRYASRYLFKSKTANDSC